VPRCHYFRPENLFSLVVSVSCAPSAHFYAYKTFALGGKRVLSVSILCCCCWVFQHKKRGEHDALSFIPPYYSRLHYFYVPIFVCPLLLSLCYWWIKEKIKKQTPSKENGGGKKINVIQIMPLCVLRRILKSRPAIEPSLSRSLRHRPPPYIFFPNNNQWHSSLRKVAKFFLFASVENIYLRRRKHRSARKQLFHQQCTLRERVACMAPAALRNTLSSRAFSK